MKHTTRNTLAGLICLTTLTLNLCPLTAPAAEIRKANNGDPLEFGSSWIGGIAPTAADVAVWDDAAGSYSFNTIQTNTSWEGIAIRDVLDQQPTIEFYIQGIGPNTFNTLSLGDAGIDASAIAADMSLAATAEGRLELAADQTWRVGPVMRRLTMACTNGGPGSLTKAGPGILRLDYDGFAFPADDSHVNNSAQLTFAGGMVELYGGMHAEIVGSARVAAGASHLQRMNGSSTLTLNNISRAVGGTLDFGPGISSFVRTSTPNDSSSGGGILGGWATYGPDWAQVINGPGNQDIVPFPPFGYSPDFLPFNNVNVTNSVVLANTTAVTINSLRLVPMGSPDVSLTVGTSGNYPLTIQSGGILSVGENTIESASGARTLRGPAGGDLIFNVFAGVLSNRIVLANNSGSSLTKSGPGMLILDPPGNNTYTGPTRINEGTLMSGTVPGRRYVSSSLFIDGGINAPWPGFQPLGVAAFLHGPTNDHLNGVNIVMDGGMLHMNGQVDSCNTLTMSNNATLTGFDTGSYLIVTNRSSNAVFVTSGTVDEVLDDWGGLIKSKSGTLMVQRDSWVYGPTVIESGTLWVTGSTNPGPTETTLTLTSLALGSATNAAKIILGGTNGPGSLVVTSLVANLGSRIVGPRYYYSGGALVLNFDYDTNFDVGLLGGPQDGEGSVGLTKMGAGVLTLNGAANYYGVTTISSSKAILGNAAALSPDTGLVVSNGVMDLNGFNCSVGGLGGNGLITNSGGPLTLTVQNGGYGFIGNLADGNGQVSLVVTNYASQWLGGVNTYSGDTMINPNANLYVSGSTRSGLTTVYGYLGLSGNAVIGSGTGNIVLAGGRMGLDPRNAPISNPLYSSGNSMIFTFSPTGPNYINFSGPLSVTSGSLTFANSHFDSYNTLFEPRLSASFTCNGQIVVTNDISSYPSSGPPSATRLCSFNPLGTTQTFNGPITGDGSFRRSATTSTGGVTVFNGTNTYAGETLVDNGTLLVNGVVMGNTVGMLYTAAVVTVTNRGVLGGNGLISGIVTVQNGGVLAPGASIGQLTIGQLTFAGGGTCAMELNKAAGTNAFVTGIGTLTYGGTLSLTNLGGVLAAGDSFNLFSATTYAGMFTNVVPATPGPGLVWDTSSLSTNGILKVSTQPASPLMNSAIRARTNFIVSGSGGTANGTYYVLASANAAAPMTNWTRIATNNFDTNGKFIFTNVVSQAVPQMFFRLQLP